MSGKKKSLTFTAWICDLSKGVVTCVALATNHTGPTLALACLWVTWPWEGTHWVAVTWQAGVRAPRMVMKLLDRKADTSEVCMRRHTYQTQMNVKCHSAKNSVSDYITTCIRARFIQWQKMGHMITYNRDMNTRAAIYAWCVNQLELAIVCETCMRIYCIHTAVWEKNDGAVTLFHSLITPSI